MDAAGLRSVVADLPAGFAWGAWASHLLGAQNQDLFQGLVSDFMDYGFYDLAGVLDQVQDGKQDLPIGAAELFDHCGRLPRSAGHDVVRFLHGGRLLSGFCVWQPDSIESAPTAAYQPSTNCETSS
ncbi:MAG: hypothetical protein WB460_02515, partial [Candidatus Acidiferrales bacterium]